jgi:rhamnosyl/mannosyltransferase
MNRFLGSMDRIVCTSPNYFATSDVLPRFANKVDVIPIGVDETSYVNPSDEMLAAAEAKCGRDFFLFVGVLRYYKGLHILLDAIQGAPYDVVIVGSGPTERELKRQADDLGLDNVIFTGYLPDEEKLSLLRLCRGVVFPSYMRSEAFGVTLLEGAMYGRPLISTEVGSGTSHVNIDGETGLVVPPGSPKALRHAMDQLWHRPDLARHMGHNARLRYERLFTGHVMGTRYYELYRQLIDTPVVADDARPRQAQRRSAAGAGSLPR